MNASAPRITFISLLPAILAVLFCAGLCRADEPLFRDGVESYAWGTPYAQFAAQKDVECIPKEFFCRKDGEPVLGVPADPLFFRFHPKKGLYQVEIFMDEENLEKFSPRLASLIKDPIDKEKKRAGVTEDGIRINITWAENAGLEVISVTNPKLAPGK